MQRALIQQETDGTSISLVAKILANGDLELEGYDCGESVRKIWGDLDYEYWVTVKSCHLSSVLQAFLEDFPQIARSRGNQINDRAPEEVLRALEILFQVGIFRSDSDFREWLKRHGIESQFFSYI